MLKTKFGAAAALAALLSAGLSANASAHTNSDDGSWSEGHATEEQHRQTYWVELDSLNDSGAGGYARLELVGDQLDVRIRGFGFAPDLVHAQHIHGIGNSECPAPDSMPSSFVRSDGTTQFFLSTSDGAPSYGPIVSSLTTDGDTSPAAGLTIELMPVADASGRIVYDRTITLPWEVAEDLTAFQIVQHGVDFNDNGEYDLDGAGESDLAAGVPQEVTAPATCGTIGEDHDDSGHDVGHDDGTAVDAEADHMNADDHHDHMHDESGY